MTSADVLAKAAEYETEQVGDEMERDYDVIVQFKDYDKYIELK